MSDQITLKATLTFERVSGPAVTADNLLDAFAYDTTLGGQIKVRVCDGDPVDEDSWATYRLTEVDDA